MSRTPGGPHPKTGEVFRLSDLGYSQRRIAAETGLSQSTIQRILSASRLDVPADPDGVFAEFDEMWAAAEAENTLEAYRRVHKTALVCHGNGYDVPWHSLPLLMCLSEASAGSVSKSRRQALRAEISRVYADMREWRERQESA